MICSFQHTECNGHAMCKIKRSRQELSLFSTNKSHSKARFDNIVFLVVFGRNSMIRFASSSFQTVLLSDESNFQVDSQNSCRRRRVRRRPWREKSVFNRAPRTPSSQFSDLKIALKSHETDRIVVAPSSQPQ
jgi:hypothetical protein